MGFISYNLAYYGSALSTLESSCPNAESIYRAKQLLKFIDDIVDEGYFDLRDRLEEELNVVSRLRDYIARSGETPFPVRSGRTVFPEGTYSDTSVGLLSYLNQLSREALSADCLPAEDEFIPELRAFCDWIGTDEDTAYIFLLRDTLLPYLYFTSRGTVNCHAWLLGRKLTADLTVDADGDDICVRSVLNSALESGIVNSFDGFRSYCTPRIRENLRAYPAFENAVGSLLKSVEADKIIVVESGCYGTFPMLLAALDERVDVRMFTAIPHLADIYGNKLFTRAYEKNRRFETLASQDALFRYAGFESGEFKITISENEAVIRAASEEIKAMLK